MLELRPHVRMYLLASMVFLLNFFFANWDHIGISVTEAFTLGDMPYQWNAGLNFFIPKLDGVIVDIKKCGGR